MTSTNLVAGVELGGTKSITLLADGNQILRQVSVPTRSPEETLGRLAEQLKAWNAETPFAALGIASFGPLQLREDAEDYGRMLRTPKAGWSGAEILKQLTAPFSCPHQIDTDVNGAALAEYLWGAGAGCSSVCYITIGTGLGGGLLINGQPVHGAMHPEIGHLRLRRAPGDSFAGGCPFHGDCIEGLVAGPALAARFGAPAETVSDDHPHWAYVASDLAQLVCTLLLTTAPQRILFGGSVSNARGALLLAVVRQEVVRQLESYLPFISPATAGEIIRPAALGDKAGPLGAVALALRALGG
ncbi:ROK family protein [Hyphomonas sp.]|uniref:ROK family protein n=1 Tax=Hyphomonas sp. TaxID=87 RepID=UPI003918D234